MSSCRLEMNSRISLPNLFSFPPFYLMPSFSPSPLSISPPSLLFHLLSISPHYLSLPFPSLAGFSCSQSSRRIDDDSLEEQIRQTSEDSRALRELMEGERGKLRQSLEELQQLHSQVSTPSSALCRECALVPQLPPLLYEN